MEAFRAYCLSKKMTTEDLPFDENTLVFKVAGKMFALADINLFESINLKCNPEKALELREEFPQVAPGFHMNKKHWITIKMNGSLADALVKEWIDHSYAEVVKGLPLKVRRDLM